MEQHNAKPEQLDAWAIQLKVLYTTQTDNQRTAYHTTVPPAATRITRQSTPALAHACSCATPLLQRPPALTLPPYGPSQLHASAQSCDTATEQPDQNKSLTWSQHLPKTPSNLRAGKNTTPTPTTNPRAHIRHSAVYDWTDPPCPPCPPLLQRPTA